MKWTVSFEELQNGEGRNLLQNKEQGRDKQKIPSWLCLDDQPFCGL